MKRHRFELTSFDELAVKPTMQHLKNIGCKATSLLMRNTKMVDGKIIHEVDAIGCECE